MVTGDPGHNGLAAPRHVDLEIEAGQETVTTQLQLMEAETVRDPAQRLELVTQILVLVTQILVQVNNVCLLLLDIGYEYICIKKDFIPFQVFLTFLKYDVDRFRKYKYFHFRGHPDHWRG